MEKTQSMPSLSFGASSTIIEPVAPTNSFFGRRANELHAMEEQYHLHRTESTASAHESMDGFDLDDVYGQSSTNFAFSSTPSFSNTSGSNATINSGSSRSTKRGFEDEIEETEERMDEEMELALTDVEDEAEEVVSNLPRRLAGSKRAFAKTQSHPVLSFSTPF